MRFKRRVTSTETIRVTANTVAKCMSNLLIICQFPYRIDRATAKSGLTWRRDKGHRTMAPGLMRFQLDLGARPHSVRAELGGTPIRPGMRRTPESARPRAEAAACPSGSHARRLNKSEALQTFRLARGTRSRALR